MSFGENLYVIMYKLLSPFGMESSATDRDKWARFPFGDLTDAEQNHIQGAFEEKLKGIMAYLDKNGLTIADLMENGEWKSGNEDFIGLLSQLAESIGCTYDSTAGALMFSANGSTTDGVFPFVAVKAAAVATDKTYLVSGSTLSAIGDAIRAKEGTTEKYRPATMAQKITEDLVKPSGTLQIKSAQQVDVRSYQYAKVTDANLTAGNIKKDVTILGVTGTHEGGGGGASANWNDVTFIDYDGSVLYSYSLAEAQALTELPALPSHDGLVCQGWNWTLEAIKALNRPVTVGAMYITDDGATRLHIRIATVGRMTVPLYIGQTVANGVSIDWGDGSAAKTLSGTGNVNTSHTYAEPGDYIISLMPQGGCKLSFGNGSSSYCLMGSTGNNGIVYCNMLQEVYVGKNVTSIGNNAFRNCYSLVSITIPDGVTSIGNNAFYNCRSLVSITIPDSVTSISNYTFNACSSLASITIPDSVTSINGYAFSACFSLASITIPSGVTSISDAAFNACNSLASITILSGVTSIGTSTFSNCHSLASITIPDSVTSINSYAFERCYGMRYYDFSACTAIPSLPNKNAFQNIPSDCQMLIPSALYNNWKSATNWTTYASKMVSV